MLHNKKEIESINPILTVGGARKAEKNINNRNERKIEWVSERKKKKERNEEKKTPKERTLKERKMERKK